MSALLSFLGFYVLRLPVFPGVWRWAHGGVVLLAGFLLGKELYTVHPVLGIYAIYCGVEEVLYLWRGEWFLTDLTSSQLAVEIGGAGFRFCVLKPLVLLVAGAVYLAGLPFGVRYPAPIYAFGFRLEVKSGETRFVVKI